MNLLRDNESVCEVCEFSLLYCNFVRRKPKMCHANCSNDLSLLDYNSISQFEDISRMYRLAPSEDLWNS